MKLIEAVEEVLTEDPRTRQQQYLWTFLIKVLNKLGHHSFIELKKGIPSPESIIRTRRDILNKKNKFPEDFVPEDNTIYEKNKNNVKGGQ